MPYIFPEEVLQEANSFSDEVLEKDLKDRTDFSNLLTVTIDGEDAKDFDDAISIEKKEDYYRLYVHIADVSHYVKSGSALDREALSRGNSVYLLDRVIPMLPEKLSNGLSSLNPGKIRLTQSVQMDIDLDGNVLKYDFFESFIKSDYRLVYNDVSDYLENGKDVYKDNKLKEMLNFSNELYKILREKRIKNGALNFVSNEAKFTFDKEGRVIDVFRDIDRTANRIIEEFMIVTNITVAEHFGNMEIPFIYRIHDKPSDEKLYEIKPIFYSLGYQIKGNNLYSKDFQKILEASEGKPEEMIVSTLLLRSMAKARYENQRASHFGLALEYYTHFTSPIRRYADLYIHRIFKSFVKNRLYFDGIDNKLKSIEKICDHISFTERRADEAEREVEKLLKVILMEGKIGEVFEGVISSTTSFGLFVELENTVEGLISFNSMTDDFYIFDENQFLVYGQKNRKIYKIGQRVKVRLVNTNLNRREIDFEIVDGDEDE